MSLGLEIDPDPYLYLKYIIQNNIYSDVDIIITTNYLKSGLSPFTQDQNNKSLFELAVEYESKLYIKMFIINWILNPCWSMHDEIYKLQEKKDIKSLKLINNIIMSIPERQRPPTANHLLNILYLAIII